MNARKPKKPNGLLPSEIDQLQETYPYRIDTGCRIALENMRSGQEFITLFDANLEPFPTDWTILALEGAAKTVPGPSKGQCVYILKKGSRLKKDGLALTYYHRKTGMDAIMDTFSPPPVKVFDLRKEQLEWELEDQKWTITATSTAGAGMKKVIGFVVDENRRIRFFDNREDAQKAADTLTEQSTVGGKAFLLPWLDGAPIYEVNFTAWREAQ